MEKFFPLNELIDLEELQSIQNSFARAVGISSVIFSAEGEPLTRFANPTGFCSLIQSTVKGKERCFRSFMEMGKIAIESEKPEIFYCFAHGGHFVAPIIIDGEHKGMMFAGQFTPEKFSSEQLHDLEEIAHEIDLDPGLLVKEAEKMRVVREDVIRNYSSLLFKIVETIVKRCAQATELSRVNDAFQRAQDGLEKRVRERTAELAKAYKGLEQEVAERKLAEEAVSESEEKYRTIYDSSKDAIMTLTPEEGFLSGNPAAVKIFGFKSEKELILRTPHDLSPQYQPDGALSSEKTQQMMAIAMKKGSHLFEWTHKRIDGKEFPTTVLLTRMELQGRRVLQAAVRNITEQKAAETALRESEEKIRMITASANDAIIMIDPEGNITYWNKAAEQMFDYTEEEVIGKDLHAILVPERFHAGFSKGFEKFKETGQGTALGKTVELAAFGKDGKEFSVELSLSAVKLKGGWNAIGFIRNITERKTAEEELKKKADELGKFNKLAVGREVKMIELKKEINAFLEKSGQEPGYKIVGKPQGGVF